MKKVVIYTDGACSGNPGPGGYAAILTYGDTEKVISGGEDNTTNNRMELKAPIEALKALKSPCEVEIYSDSTYVVDSYNKGWVYNWARNNWTKKDGDIKNLDLVKELYFLCKTHKVTWYKVKGHSDNEYNNRCDAIAVSQAKNVITRKAVSEKVRDNIYLGDLEEKITQTEDIFTGRVFKVEVCKVDLPDGGSSVREIVRHNGGAAVVAVRDGKIYMVRQFRLAAGKEMLEIPAGKLEKGEDPMLCASRELTEETGMVANRIQPLLSLYPTPGYCSEKLHLYYATDLVDSRPHRDEGEFLHIVELPFEEVYKMVLNGEIDDAKTCAGVLAAKQLFM